MRLAGLVVVALLLAIAAAMLWQHHRYLRVRRDLVQDRQPLLYGGGSFHVVTFLRIRVGVDLIESVRALAETLESAPNARLIYAGQAAFTRASEQLGERSWDAVVLTQYPSRQAYETAAASEAQRTALARFADVYTHGMKRPRALNLLLPQGLLLLRLTDVLRGNWTIPPLEPLAELDPELRESVRSAQAELRRLRAVNDRALVVFNLIRAGSAEQQAADRSYGTKMITRMAGLTHGPMHVGRAVTLEGDARFDQVVIVYYPGPGYFADLIGSEFFQGIIGDKQLADTQAVPTVPILSELGAL